MPEAPASTLMQILQEQNFTGLNEAAQDFYNDAMGFAHAIDWSEQWLMGLGAFHAIVWLVAIATRRNNDAQMVLLISILGMVYCAEYVNTWASQHWQEFAGQNYFDKRGVFISVMYSAPMLALALLVLLNALRHTSSLLIKVKRQELRANQRKKAKEAKVE